MIMNSVTDKKKDQIKALIEKMKQEGKPIIGLPSYCAEASESCPTRQDFFILLSWHISLRKCPQSVKHSCTDQGHLLRDGQTRNDRLHQSRMISVGVHALHLNPVHSSFVCPTMPLTSFFASALRVSKNYAHPKAERQDWFCY